jgi:hypothetical protein
MRQFFLILLTAISLSGFFSPAEATGLICIRAQNTTEVEEGVVTASPYRAFQRQFNSKVISRENMFVSAEINDQRLPGRLTAIFENAIEIEVYHEGEYKGIHRISGSDLDSVRVSKKAEFEVWRAQKAIYGMQFSVSTYAGTEIKGQFVRFDDTNKTVHFQENGQSWKIAVNQLNLFTWTNTLSRPMPEPSPGFKFRQVPILPYKASNGQDVVIDYHSPFIRNMIGSGVEQAEGNLGIRRGQPLSEIQRHQLYRFWLDYIIPSAEEKDSRNYAKRRNEILNGFNRQGQILSRFVEEKACVCRELSLLTASFLAEFGLYTKIARGIVDSSDGQIRGGHAWVHVYDARGNLLEVINTNGPGKNFFTDRDSFFRHRNVELEYEVEIMRP